MVGGGLSGSEKFLLSFPGHDVFLKVAHRSHGAPGWNRACREFAFYRDLADKMPVWLPYLLASRADGDSILMLFVAYESRLAQHWEARDWLDVVQELACMHGTYHGLRAIDGLDWLPPYVNPATPAVIRDATAQWKLLSEREDLDRVFKPSDRGWISRIASCRGWDLRAFGYVGKDPLPRRFPRGELASGF